MSGIFGAYNIKGNTEGVTKSCYYGIFSLQHRGQESAGIAVNNGGSFLIHKNPGLVTDVFDEVTISYQANRRRAQGVSTLPEASGTYRKADRALFKNDACKTSPHYPIHPYRSSICRTVAKCNLDRTPLLRRITCLYYSPRRASPFKIRSTHCRCPYPTQHPLPIRISSYFARRGQSRQQNHANLLP